MIDKRLLNEIDKSIKFILKKITEGKMIVSKINEKEKMFINIKDGEYEIREFNVDKDSGYSDVLIVGEDENTLEEIKTEVEKEKSILDNGGLLIIKQIISNKEHMDSVKEEILEVFNEKGIEDIKVYFVYSKTDLANKTLSVVLMGRKHLDLLKDRPDYEEYSSNVVEDKKCGGCSHKKEECSQGGCNGKSCCKK